MRGLIAIALLLIVGQASAEQIEQVISVQHDSQRGVTCWVLNDKGISCLPDSSLLQAPTSSSSDEGEAAQASLATSMCQNEQLPTTPLLQDERFRL